MTIIEAGIMAGMPTGAIVGGTIFNESGVIGVAGGAVAGLVAGAVAGWLYAYALILLLSVAGVLWRAARRRPMTPPTEADLKAMTPTAVLGTLICALAALACWLKFGWPHALAAVAVVSAATAVVTVARGATS